MKTVVTVSRKWNNPEIKTVVEDAGIALTIELDDFKTALKQEIGSVAWTFSKKTFDTMIDDAFVRIVEGVKEESAKVM
jgi:hypothetical protein